MPFKVKCTLIAFMGDEDTFPCHFGYKVGDEFIYDGEKFIGKICPGLLSSMIPVIAPIHYGGNKYAERILFRYAGLSKRDPNMKKYDGQGFAPVNEPPKGFEKHFKVQHLKPETERQKGWTFVCGDSRTSALFLAEPFDLAEGGFHTPFYRREMGIFEKIQTEPGISTDEILDRFSEWEREEIFPPLTPLMLELMLDELEHVNYIEIRDGKAYLKRP